MAYFLLKTEPTSFSLDDLEKQKRTVWDGVRNALALKHLRAMKKGDSAFIYHTGDEKQVVGIAKVAGNPYPEPKMKDVRYLVVDIVFDVKLKNPVPLAAIKARRDLKDFPLVRLSRLSVMPVTEEEWETILAMSK
ncbi:MAG: EVE domain-containing protein [Bacteroidota bacterium]|nr:EVE domain-containing protein [Bacteroidota bacterium]